MKRIILMALVMMVMAGVAWATMCEDEPLQRPETIAADDSGALITWAPLPDLEPRSQTTDATRIPRTGEMRYIDMDENGEWVVRRALVTEIIE